MTNYNVTKVNIKDNCLDCKYEVFDEVLDEDYTSQYKSSKPVHPDLHESVQSMGEVVVDLIPPLVRMRKLIDVQGFYIVPSGTARIVNIYARLRPEQSEGESVDITARVKVGCPEGERYAREDLLLEAIDRCGEEALKYINEGKTFDSERAIVLDLDCATKSRRP